MTERYDRGDDDTAPAAGASEPGQLDDRSSVDEEHAVSPNSSNEPEEPISSQSSSGPQHSGDNPHSSDSPDSGDSPGSSDAPGSEGVSDSEGNGELDDSGEAEVSESSTEPEAGAGEARVLAFPHRDGGDRDVAERDRDAQEGGVADEDLVAAREFEEDELEDDGLEDAEAVDLSALRADDALLDALGGTDPQVSSETGDSSAKLDSLLVSWRREVDAEPIGELVSTDAAVAAISAGRRPARQRPRFLVPMASAAAVLVIAFTGVGLAARDALPGDALWGVAQVLYSDHTSSVQAASSAQGNLELAQQALENGRQAEAENALQRAQKQLPDIAAEDGRKRLEAAHTSLSNRYDRSDSSPTRSSTSSETSQSQEHPPPMPPPLEPTQGETPTQQPPPPSTTTPSEPTTSPEEPTQSRPTSTSPSGGTSPHWPSTGSSLSGPGGGSPGFSGSQGSTSP